MCFSFPQKISRKIGGGRVCALGPRGWGGLLGVAGGSLVSGLLSGLLAQEFWAERFPLDAAAESTQKWLVFHAHYC